MSALKKYDPETQARAVRMYADRIAEGDVSQLRAREEVGPGRVEVLERVGEFLVDVVQQPVELRVHGLCVRLVE